MSAQGGQDSSAEYYLSRLRGLAVSLRAAIERCDRQRLPVTFREFPRGSCGDAAILLGTFLKEQGAGTFTYIAGRRGRGHNRYSHAWLEQDNVIVDITGDQFSSSIGSVFVATHSPWHRTFKREQQHEADYHIYDQHAVATLGNAYKAILAGVEL
jgi:hypothetical protein